MSRLSRLICCSAAVVGALGAANGLADELGPRERVARAVNTSEGRIQGTVRDTAGEPLGGATVSALGPTLAFAMTDRRGRFELAGLPPGPYVVRAHRAGFAASRRRIIEVVPSGRLLHSFALHRAAESEPPLGAPAILAAGLAPAGSRAPDEEEDEISDTDPTAIPHDHSETAWRLRHGRRSVLRDTDAVVAGFPAGDAPGGMPGTVSLLGRAFGSSARLATNLFDDLPFSGQFNLLTASNFDRPGDLFSIDQLPRGIANITIGAPAGSGDWSVRAAMTEGDVSSWILGGSYTRQVASEHSVDFGVSYSAQRYDGGNPAALAAMSANRRVGAVGVYDAWTPVKRLTLNYGGRYAWHDYLEHSGLFSPRLGVSYALASHTNVRIDAAQRVLAPGTEEFLPPAETGIWLPPERTFAPLESGQPFRVERNRHLELAVEREIAGSYIVGVRRFYDEVNDQLVTLFGVRPELGSRSDLGHYFVATAGSFEADGWGVSVGRSLAERIRGTVDYSLTRARWNGSSDDAALSKWAPSVVRTGAERFHDVTTTVETEIPETATRVFVVYRLNTAYSRPSADDPAPGFDARFDVQVKQTLPFLPFGAQWEMLVAVRNLFRQTAVGGSVYDELLVVRPPKRIVGGLVVKF